jgi:hypothetical protein
MAKKRRNCDRVNPLTKTTLEGQGYLVQNVEQTIPGRSPSKRPRDPTSPLGRPRSSGRSERTLGTGCLVLEDGLRSGDGDGMRRGRLGRSGLSRSPWRTSMSGPTDDEIMEYLNVYASKAQRERKYPLWSRDEIVSECWLIWSAIVIRYGDEIDSRWRQLAKTAFNRRLPDLYQKSLGKKIRRSKDHKRSYHSDLDLGYVTPAKSELPRAKDDIFALLLRAVQTLATLVNHAKDPKA